MENFTSGSFMSDDQAETEVSRETQYIIVLPDGTMTVYDPDTEAYTSASEDAYILWASKYGALDKPFKLYSVSEALLLVIAVASVVFIFGKIFKRRKL